MTPISGAGAASFANVEGHREKPEDWRYVSINWVAPRYFETLGTPFLAGRDSDFRDENRTRVAVINQSMARYYFSGASPIGKHLTLDRDWKGFGQDQPYEIVGVVGDAKYSEIREAAPHTIYFNTFQEGRPASQFALRTSVVPAAVVGEARRAVRDVLKTVPVERITTMAEQIDASILSERLIATLSGLFGVLGAVLTAVGIYGLLAYLVSLRTNEIGIRMALGATRSDVSRMLLGDALRMVSAGLLIGGVIAYWSKTLAATWVEGLPLHSVAPIVFGVVALLAIALIAASVPTRRAARVDPMEALRHE